MLAALALQLVPTPPVAAVEHQVYMTGLEWPAAMAVAPDGRIFYAELFSGRIRIIEDRVLLPQPFIVLPNTVADGELGLLGLALDPGFPSSPWVYAYQTYDNTSDGTQYNRIVRVRAQGNIGTLDRVLLAGIPMANIHNGGVLTFGPDGNLYAVTGDALDQAAAQDLGSLAGKTLRMRPDGSVPPDNPFVATSGANPYVYTYGHRNGFGLAFHPTTGGLYETENGPACVDEVNLLRAGQNYGWGPSHDPFACVTPPPMPYNTNQDGPSPVLPMHWWESTIAPTNAVVSRGPGFPEFQGDLLVGDFNTGSLRRLDLAPPAYDTVLSESVLLTVSEAILDVEAGPDGDIWFTTPSTIHRYWNPSRGPQASFTATPVRVNPGGSIRFDASASTDPDGTIVSYGWEFGDGTTGSGVVADHTYASPGTYAVRLTVVDNDARANTTVADVRVNAPPIAAMVATPSSGYLGDPIAFDGRSSSDPEGGVLAFAWDFGDGATASGPEASHRYSARGTYSAVLTVIDDLGLQGRAALLVDIVNRAPEVSGSPSPIEFRLQPGQSTTFSVNGSDPDGDALTYSWTVNGVVVESDSASLTFSEADNGTYVVNVTVSDGSLETWHEWTVTVGIPPVSTIAPAATFTLAAWMIAALLAALAAVAIFVGLRRKRTKGPRTSKRPRGPEKER